MQQSHSILNINKKLNITKCILDLRRLEDELIKIGIELENRIVLKRAEKIINKEN